MTAAQFQNILDRRIMLITATLAAKGKEYADGNDRLHNFRRAAQIQGCNEAQALMGMLVKHLVSVLDMVHNSDNPADFSIAQWEEKIGDAINYLILLEAIVKERTCQK